MRGTLTLLLSIAELRLLSLPLTQICTMLSQSFDRAQFRRKSDGSFETYSRLDSIGFVAHDLRWPSRPGGRWLDQRHGFGLNGSAGEWGIGARGELGNRHRAETGNRSRRTLRGSVDQRRHL